MIGVWMTALGVLMAYAGCVLLFQSGERRARHPAVRIAREKMGQVKIAGWALAIGSLLALSAPQGVERGSAVWLGVLGFAGTASLLVSALFPRLHMFSIPAAGILCAALAVTYRLLETAP